MTYFGDPDIVRCNHCGNKTLRDVDCPVCEQDPESPKTEEDRETWN